MRTYQVFVDNALVKDKATITEAYLQVKAGSKLISGNKFKTTLTPTGPVEEVLEWRAHFRTPSGGSVTIIENKSE